MTTEELKNRIYNKISFLKYKDKDFNNLKNLICFSYYATKQEELVKDFFTEIEYLINELLNNKNANSKKNIITYSTVSSNFFNLKYNFKLNLKKYELSINIKHKKLSVNKKFLLLE